MKSKKMVFGIMLFLFILINIYSIQNVFTIENPDYTFEINPNDYSYIKFYSLDVSDQLNVEVEVIAGGNNLIDVYLVDSANFQEYQGGQSSFAKVVHQGVSYINFDYTITYLDDYYLILSNPAVFIYVKTVEVKTTIVEAEKSIQIDYPVYSTIFYIEEDDYYNNCPIQWETTGDIDYITIKLYEGGYYVETIVSGTANDGYYEWSIYYSDGYEGSNYRIKISDYYDSSVYSFSDYFTIEIEAIEEPDPYEPYLPTDYSYIVRNIFFFVIIPIIVGVGVVIGYIVFKKKSQKESIIQEKEIPKITYCPECGTEVDKEKVYCSRCGSKIN